MLPLIIQISSGLLRQPLRTALQISPLFLEEAAMVKRWLRTKYQAYVVGYVGTYGAHK